MKTLLRISFLVLIILTIAANTSKGSVNTKPDPDSLTLTDSNKVLPTIQLITPNGGEELTGFSLIEVQWKGTNLNMIYPPTIYISLDGGITWIEANFWNTIEMSDLGGSAYYLLPSILSSQLKIKLADVYHPEVYDISDNNFSITSFQQLQVLIYGPDFTRITSNLKIDFGIIIADLFDEDYFTISVTFDEGVNWEIVKQHVKIGYNLPGPIFWEIPYDTYGTCQVKFQSESVPERNGTSVCFTIHKVPEIEISLNYPQNLVHTDTTFVIDYYKIDENYLYDVYLLYMSKNKGITWEYIKTLTLDANSGNFQLNSPMQETDSCLFRVIDATNGNSSDITDYISFRNFPAVPICQVTNDPTTKKNLIKWSKPESDYISEYAIFRETDETDVYEEIARIPKNNSAEYVDLTSNPDERAYRYRLGYIDSEDWIYPLSSPHQTTHLSVYKSYVKGYNLIWSNYTGADIQSYTIYRGTTETNLSEIEKVSGNNTSFTDLNAPTGTLYYRIQATGTSDCSGIGDFNSNSNIAGESSLGIIEESNTESFAFYPNPAKDKLYLRFEKPNNALIITITDLQGRVVYTNQLDSPAEATFDIDLNTLNNGAYILHLKSNALTTSKKLIINR
jgi:hypothetical protein